MTELYDSNPPLIFLTTTTSDTPSGRNVRSQVRARSARSSNPVSATTRGTFGTFNALSNETETASDEVSHLRKRPRKESCPTDLVTVRQNTLDVISSPSIPFLVAHFSTRSSPISPNVNLEDVLKVAAFHIKRTAARTLFSQPDRALEALRCRQWCSVSSTLASFGRTPYLDSAIACVVSKVQQVITGSKAEERMLFSYTYALHHLRAAVIDPTLHDMHDMLATTRLLAVYEMLDFPDNGSWVQHVVGAAAMAKLQSSENNNNTTGQSLRSGQFVEALLNNDHEFFDSASWKALVQTMVLEQQNSTSNLGNDISSGFVSLRVLFADIRAAAQDRAVMMSWSMRFSLLARAHEVRCRIKKVILSSEKEFGQGRKKFKEFDFLGMFLLVVITLDRLIMSLRPVSTGRGGSDLQDDTKELCVQLIRFELAATDEHPGRDLLRAFQRQTQYPLLTYVV